MTIGEAFGLAGFGLLVLFCAFLLFVVTPRNAWVKSACLELGYAEHEIDWRLRAYCVQRDYNGVMHSIPLDEARIK